MTDKPENIKQVMSWLGKQTSEKKKKSSADNLKKAREKRWPGKKDEKTLDRQ